MKKAFRESLFKKLPLGKKYFENTKIQYFILIHFWLMYFVAYFEKILRLVFGILFGNTFDVFVPIPDNL